ncbi:hypothetical protein AX14_013314 [Amanita brunnescens Koide BX004]|nr:hypothetical protein AX14_013314 [Amanita brunnescens Koide BX004]
MKSRRKTLVLMATLGSMMIKSITVSAGNVNPRLSALYDRYGQSPCALEERVKSVCPSSQSNSIPSTFLSQDVGKCTCNVIFFNLWSACLLSNGNGVLPTFDQWSQSCSNNSLDINDSPFPGINTIVFPPWATMAKPSPPNTTFDVGAAIRIAQVSRGIPWTTVQIIAPILSAVATVAVLGCWYLYHYSARQRQHRFEGGPPLFRRAHKVKEMRRGEAWTIDISEGLDHGHEARMRKNFGPSNDASRNVTGGPGHRHNPSVWKKKNELPNFLSFGRPAVVQNVRPGEGWRISSLDDAVESPPFLTQSPKSIARGPNTATQPILEGEGEVIELDGPRAEAVDDDQETDHLISPTERSENSVFLISHRPGMDFTIDSSPPASRIPCSPSQASPMAVPRGTHGSRERYAIHPSQERTNISPSTPSHSAKESSKGSSVQKPFAFLSKLKISVPSKHSRKHSNEPNPPPRTVITETLSPPSSLPFQVPEQLPSAPRPSFVNMYNRSVVSVHERASPYPSFNRHQRSSSSQSFREDVNFLAPPNGPVPSSRASPHLRTASLDV